MDFEIMLVLLVLGITIILFVTERLRVDIVAIFTMLLIAWLGLVSPAEAFSGFASNAVISIIAVMILGYGMERTGVMIRLSRFIVSLGGSNEKRLLGLVSSFVGVISAFIQNIGSAALFLPAIMRISKSAEIPPSKLLMPMGYAAILGGTLSMVGSSPLIILNDLLRQGNLEPFSLFAVTPVGLVLLGVGVVYFLIFGSYVLPVAPAAHRAEPQEDLITTWQLPTMLHHLTIPEGSPLAGKEREDIPLKDEYNLHLLAIAEGPDVLYAPWRYTSISAGQTVSVLGERSDAERFAHDFGLKFHPKQARFTELICGEDAGFAEIVVRPRSSLGRKTFREIAFRKTYGVEPLVLVSGEEEMRGDFSNHMLSAGDIIVIFGPWLRIRAFSSDPNFILVTPVEGEPLRKSKANLALLCFVGAIALTFTGVQISLALLTGAIGMVIGKVITIHEAYRAIDLRTIFLLAGLIPLGIAMEKTGTAAFISGSLMQYLQGSHPVVILLGIAILTTFFTLFMSNVAATVILVPLVLIIGTVSGIDPRGLALLVGICASNSFILPTHQVNAFLMAPGGYKNTDYIRAGGIMTVLFILVTVGLIYILFI